MQLSLKDKTVVVVGGTTGLGLSAARACSQAGARVVVVGRNVDRAREAEQIGERVHAVIGDACDAATSERAVALAVAEGGRLDGLYHVAGGSGRGQGDGPLHELEDAGIGFTIDLNLRSVILSNRAAVRQFLSQGTGGTVLNMGSVLGGSPAPRHFSTCVYAATKAAVEGLTLSCAAYYAPHDIRFNVLAPALVETPMSARAQARPEILEYVSTKQPLDGGRIGRPTDTDAAVLFFLSDVSCYVTGQTLSVDGGWSVSEGQYAHDPSSP